MKINIKPRSIIPGDIYYSRLSHTLKFTVSLNEKMIMMLENVTGNNMLSPEEAAAAMCCLLEDALLARESALPKEPKEPAEPAVFGGLES